MSICNNKTFKHSELSCVISIINDNRLLPDHKNGQWPYTSMLTLVSSDGSLFYIKDPFYRIFAPLKLFPLT